MHGTVLCLANFDGEVKRLGRVRARSRVGVRVRVRARVGVRVRVRDGGRVRVRVRGMARCSAWPTSTAR